MPSTLRIRGLLRARDEIISVSETAPVAEAAEVMDQHNVGCVVVTNAAGRLLGILSERDVLTKVVARRLDAAATPVCEVMTRELIYCTRATAIAEAQRTMAQHEIRHLPIVEDGAPVGMISSRDILAHQLSTVEQIARTQSRLIERLERTFPGISELCDGEPGGN